MECPVKDQRREAIEKEDRKNANKEKISECPVGMGSKSTSSSTSSSAGEGRLSFFGSWFNKSPSDSTSSSVNTIPFTPLTFRGTITDISPGADALKDTGEYNHAANDMIFKHERHPEQTVEFSITRTLSGIPKSDYTPSHQPHTQTQPAVSASASASASLHDKWVYPSEQQYYNAMKKKGYNPPEKDIGAILAIHNHVNESSWEKILEWEAFRGENGTSKLKRFEGRPTDLSPKARFMSFFGISPPFDRHDWYVQRPSFIGLNGEKNNGKEIRYIIDFYHVPNRRGGVPVYLDVRPALDSPQALVDRIEMEFRKRFNPKSLMSIKASAIIRDSQTKPHSNRPVSATSA